MKTKISDTDTKFLTFNTGFHYPGVSGLFPFISLVTSQEFDLLPTKLMVTKTGFKKL